MKNSLSILLIVVIGLTTFMLVGYMCYSIASELSDYYNQQMNQQIQQMRDMR